MNKIKLTLKSPWFSLVKNGQKTEDYREITPYYCARLCANYNSKSHDCRHCKTAFCRPEIKHPYIQYSLGYPPSSRTDRFTIKRVAGIRKGHGRWIWGAPNGKSFIIELEDYGDN